LGLGFLTSPPLKNTKKTAWNYYSN